MDQLIRWQQWYTESLSSADPRTQDWFLIGDIWQPLLVAALYLAMVFLGPRIMAGHSAWNINTVLIIYNFLLTLLSGYMFYEFLMSTWEGVSWFCAAVNLSNKGNPIRLAKVCWLYYISKVIEFMDTFFFILRKKNEQISFLHVYHHVTMFLWWWLVTKWYPGGSAFFGPMCNSLVHVVMYFYYMLSAMGPSMRKYLWWKKYLTYFQMIQFLIVISQNCFVLYMDCGFPIWLCAANTVYMFSLLFLFMHFSSKTYKSPPQKGGDSSKKSA